MIFEKIKCKICNEYLKLPDNNKCLCYRNNKFTGISYALNTNIHEFCIFNYFCPNSDLLICIENSNVKSYKMNYDYLLNSSQILISSLILNDFTNKINNNTYFDLINKLNNLL